MLKTHKLHRWGYRLTNYVQVQEGPKIERGRNQLHPILVQKKQQVFTSALPLPYLQFASRWFPAKFPCYQAHKHNFFCFPSSVLSLNSHRLVICLKLPANHMKILTFMGVLFFHNFIILLIEIPRKVRFLYMDLVEYCLDFYIIQSSYVSSSSLNYWWCHIEQRIFLSIYFSTG